MSMELNRKINTPMEQATTLEKVMVTPQKSINSKQKSRKSELKGLELQQSFNIKQLNERLNSVEAQARQLMNN
jgi:hypothetical protein